MKLQPNPFLPTDLPGLVRQLTTLWRQLVQWTDGLKAADIPYDNSTSGLSATTVQAAIDEQGADSGWTNATLQNGWVAFGGVYAAPSYRKVGSIVYLRGVMKNGTGTAFTVVFTLPTGFRPSAAGSYSTPAPDSPTVDARIDVNTSGTVVISATMTSTTYLAIDGIQFFID